MNSWVRYSVAVYTGLLLAGAAIAPRPQASIGSDLPQGQPQPPVSVMRLPYDRPQPHDPHHPRHRCCDNPSPGAEDLPRLAGDAPIR